jgi:5-methylthioadenosine/S-adenosylhomocysteine deaminase
MDTDSYKMDAALSPDLIIEGGTLITMVAGQAPLRDAKVLIKGDKVINILPSGQSSPLRGETEIIHAKDCIIMPGLINAHAHTANDDFQRPGR